MVVIERQEGKSTDLWPGAWRSSMTALQRQQEARSPAAGGGVGQLRVCSQAGVDVCVATGSSCKLTCCPSE